MKVDKKATEELKVEFKPLSDFSAREILPKISTNRRYNAPNSATVSEFKIKEIVDGLELVSLSQK